MEERTLDEATRTALNDVAETLPDSEQQYFSLQMAWVEMLDAIGQLAEAAKSGKPMDIAFYGEAEVIAARITALQNSIRANALRNYDPTPEELGVQDDDDPNHDPEYRAERFMPELHDNPNENE